MTTNKDNILGNEDEPNSEGDVYSEFLKSCGLNPQPRLVEILSEMHRESLSAQLALWAYAKWRDENQDGRSDQGEE